jgi:hypothetical protein
MEDGELYSRQNKTPDELGVLLCFAAHCKLLVMEHDLICSIMRPLHDTVEFYTVNFSIREETFPEFMDAPLKYVIMVEFIGVHTNVEIAQYDDIDDVPTNHYLLQVMSNHSTLGYDCNQFN